MKAACFGPAVLCKGPQRTLRPVLIRIAFPRTLLAIPLPRQCRLDALLLAWLQIEGVPLNIFDDVLLQDLPLKASKRAL